MPTEAPSQGFALADFGDTVLPDNLPAEGGAQPSQQQTAPDKPQVSDTPSPAKDEPAPDETAAPEGGAKPEKEDDDPAVNINEAMDRQKKRTEEQEAQRKKDDEAKATEAAELDAKKAGEAPKETEKPKDGKERDSDLAKIDLNSNAHPKTRKNFNDIKAIAKAARDERDGAVAEAETHKQKIAEMEKRVAELEQATKSGKPPKELEEKLKVYEERIRELDITKDPEIQQKYDGKMVANNKAIVDLLKANGYGQIKGEDGKYQDDPKAIAALEKSGLTLSSLRPMLDKLEAAGLSDEAEQIRESVRENMRLSRERQGQIDQWKGSYEQRTKAREEQGRIQQENHQKAVGTARDAVLKRDMETLEKDLPFLKEPPMPQPNDPAPLAKAKQAQRDAWNAAQAKVRATLETFKTEGISPEKFSEIAGSLSANAVQAVILKQHAIPALVSQLNAAKARIQELEGRVGRQEAAGKLSRVHGGSGPTDPNAGKPEPETLEQAFGNGPQ